MKTNKKITESELKELGYIYLCEFMVTTPSDVAWQLWKKCNQEVVIYDPLLSKVIAHFKTKALL